MTKTACLKHTRSIRRLVVRLRAGGVWPSLVLLLLAAVSGCVSPRTPTRLETGDLPRPGARVALGDITNATGQTFEADVVTLLKGAMAEELARQEMQAGPEPRPSDLFLHLQITEYRPGNAFKRWLLPWYGATVLAVQGDLLDAATGVRAATVLHQRTVAAGGLYTVGAWKSVFGSMARDLAKDLKVRIERGGEFVVSATPRADIVKALGPVENAAAVRIAGFHDRRPETGRIGQRQAAFGVSMGDVHFSRDVAGFVREALEAELAAAGHGIVETGGDLTVTGQVLKFWVKTETTPLYWDVTADIGLVLEVRRAGTEVRREFSATSTKRTYVWPTSSLLGGAIDACMEKLMNEVRADPVWK